MADAKISDLTALTAANLAPGDLAHVVDISDISMAGTGTNKKVTVGDLATYARSVYNASVAAQGAGFATDTYVTGSNIAIPAGRLQAKTMYRCILNVVRTNASGTAAPVLNVRFGTAATTSDTSRGQLTFSAQTGVADEGIFEVWATFRTVGSGTSAVLQTLGRLTHRLSVTGLGTGVSEPEIATSGGFDSTVASSIIGISLNGGTSSTWTVSLVQSELFNLI